MSIGLVDKTAKFRHTCAMVDTQHGKPAAGALLDVVWNDRRAEEFDEGCRRD